MEKVDRFDCSSGGVPYCQGCYIMEKSELGDYVSFEDYNQLRQKLEVEIEKNALLKISANQLYAAQSSIEDMREKLEAAEARIIDLKEVIASYEHLAASDARKINELEHIIRDAREQNQFKHAANAHISMQDDGPVIDIEVIDGSFLQPEMSIVKLYAFNYIDVDCETCGGAGFYDERLGGYFFSNQKAKCPDCDGDGSVPAIPVQDDKPMPIETAPLEGEFLAERSNGEWLIVHNQKDVFKTGNRIVCHGESGRFWAAKRWMPLVKSEVKPS